MSAIDEQIAAAEEERNGLAERARLAWQTYNDLDRKIDRLNDEIRALRRQQRGIDTSKEGSRGA